MCQSLAARQYKMMLALTVSDPESEQRCIKMMQQNKVDGIIGFDGVRRFTTNDYHCSTIIQPMARLAETTPSGGPVQFAQPGLSDCFLCTRRNNERVEERSFCTWPVSI